LGFYDQNDGGNFDLDRIVLNNLIVAGASGGRLAERVMALMSDGPMDLAPLVTGVFPIGDAVGILESGEAKKAENVKMLIKMA
jgi:threonine dehydrogenase-like Zn-dependent dehydrogenase